jgi:hypothetical protein
MLVKGSAVGLVMHNAVAVYPLLVSKNEELTNETTGPAAWFDVCMDCEEILA